MECPQIKRRENQHSKPSFPACAQRKSWCWPASRFPCLVNCSMRQEQHKALVSRINPSLVLLVLWVNDFGVQPPGHNQYSLEHHVKLDRTLLLSPHSWTPPSRCFVFACGSKSSWKIDFCGLFLFPVWRFFQHKIIPGWRVGGVAESSQALLRARLLAGPRHAERRVGRDECGRTAVVLRVQAMGTAPCSWSNLGRQ